MMISNKYIPDIGDAAVLLFAYIFKERGRWFQVK
jgi:hypothetical protein